MPDYLVLMCVLSCMGAAFVMGYVIGVNQPGRDKRR